MTAEMSVRFILALVALIFINATQRPICLSFGNKYRKKIFEEKKKIQDVYI